MTDTATVEQLKPLVIRRGDAYVVHGVPGLFENYTRVQRVGIAQLAWDQMATLMEQNGESIANAESVARRLAEAFDVSFSGVEQAQYAMRRNGADHLDRLIAGEISVKEFLRESGMQHKFYVKQGVTHAKDGVTYYGKGDPFWEVMEPVRRYLRAWKKRGFEFRHLAPREAKKRLDLVQSMIALLQEVEQDLEKRSHLATLSAPRDRKEKKST